MGHPVAILRPVSERTDQLAANGLWGQLDAVDSALTAAAASDATPQSARSILDRVRKVETRVRQLLDGVDADLVNLTLLTEMANHFSNIANWTASTGTGSDQSQPIATGLDIFPGWLSQLAAALPSIPNAKSTAAVASVRREAEAAASDLGVRATALGNQLSDTNSALGSLRSEIDALAAQMNTTRDENAQVVANVRQVIDTEKTTALQKVESDARLKLEAFDEEVKEKLAKIDETLAVELNESENVLAKLRALEENAREIVASVGERVLTGDFGASADDERKVANRMRNGAIATSTIGAGFVVWATYVASVGSITWQRLAAKLGATVVFSGLATYLGSQSREHRNEERRARKRQLDLKTLGPFIESLPIERQQSIRNELALRSFLNDPSELHITRQPRKGFSVDDIKTMVELVNNAKK